MHRIAIKKKTLRPDKCTAAFPRHSDYYTILVEERSNKYTLFDGLAYNTCGYFASCVVFFRALQGRGKIGAMSKMSARAIC